MIHWCIATLQWRNVFSLSKVFWCIFHFKNKSPQFLINIPIFFRLECKAINNSFLMQRLKNIFNFTSQYSGLHYSSCCLISGYVEHSFTPQSLCTAIFQNYLTLTLIILKCEMLEWVEFLRLIFYKPFPVSL